MLYLATMIPLFLSDSYAGYSKKGFAAYNPRKRNQDALIMAEDASTASLFLAVLDGHGEDGDKVAQVRSALLFQIAPNEKSIPLELLHVRRDYRCLAYSYQSRNLFVKSLTILYVRS